jgi:hypothetical protein
MIEVWEHRIARRGVQLYQTVEIRGLKGNASLNGQIGLPFRFDHTTSRFGIMLDDGKQFSIRETNLYPSLRALEQQTRIEGRVLQSVELVEEPDLEKATAEEVGACMVKWGSCHRIMCACIARILALGFEGSADAINCTLGFAHSPGAVEALADWTSTTFSPEGMRLGMMVLSFLSTGFGSLYGGEFSESSQGLEVKTILAESGALEAALQCLMRPDKVSFKTSEDLALSGLTVVQTITLGSDSASDGHESRCGKIGCPHEASKRRQRAVDAGGLEVLLQVMQAHTQLGDNGSTQVVNKTLYTLERLCFGDDKSGEERRVRAASLGALPAITAALNVHFSQELLERSIGTSSLIMGRQKHGDFVKPALDHQWQAALAAQPGLMQKIQQAMMQKMMTRVSCAQGPAGP